MNRPAADKTPVSKNQAEQSDTEEVNDENSSFLGTVLSAIPEFSQTWLTSMILHTGLIVILAIITMTQIKDDTITIAVGEVAPAVENIIEIPLEFEEMEEPVEEELTEMFEESMTIESDVITEVVENDLIANSDFGDLSADVDMSAVIGDGDSLEEASKSAPKFFKTGGTQATKIVYVVDNSNSMTGRKQGDKGYGRMETALIELAKSINTLESSQYFYIVFYSDTAYGLFHPSTVSDYIPATPKNKRRVNAWLDTVECCLRTNGNEAFAIARKLDPELIYVLGDGAFGDKAHQRLVNKPIKGAKIETLGMNLQGNAANGFKAIAKAHKGTYRDVGITEDGARILAKFGPRKRNNTRGPVWGIKLPAQAKGKGKKKK